MRARERLPELRPASAAFNGQFGLVTLEEVIALVRMESRARSRPIGIVAELKHAAYFAARGLHFEEALAPAIDHAGADDAFFIECFEPAILRRLRGRSAVRLVQLIGEGGAPPDESPFRYEPMVSPEGLARIADYAAAIGPAKALVVPRGPDGSSLRPAALVDDAHAAGLLVFPWTFRSENLFLPAELRRGEDPRAHGDAEAEYRTFFGLGVDAVFSDFPEAAIRARGF